jgi:hypothetical protein
VCCGVRKILRASLKSSQQPIVDMIIAVVIMMKIMINIIIMIIIIQPSVMHEKQSSKEESMYVFWDVTLCGLVDLNIVSEERTASIFRIEK